MGSILSRRIAGVEDIDIQANSAYRYPPKSGERPVRARTARRGLGGRRGGQDAPTRGPRCRGGVGALLGPPPFLLSASPELRAPSTRIPGFVGSPRLTALSRLGDLGSVTSSLNASAPCLHTGETLGKFLGP